MAGRQVAEYRSCATGLSLLEPLGLSPFAKMHSARGLVSLERLIIPPGASFAARGGDEARLLSVESGIIVVTVAPRMMATPLDQAPSPETVAVAEDRSTPLTSAPVVVSDLLPLPPGSHIEVSNTGDLSAGLLGLTAGHPGAPGGWTSDPARPESQGPIAAGRGPTDSQALLPRPLPGGAVMAPLLDGVETTLPQEQAVIALGRATLTPGAKLPAFEATGPLVLVVEEGTLDLATHGPRAWVDGGAGRALQTATLGAATAALLHTGTAATLQNLGAESTVVTIVAVLPAGTAAGAAA